VADSVLITGGSGLLALNWALTRRAHNAVTLAMHQREIALADVTSKFLSLDRVADIVASLDVVKPDVVIHTAGLTNVEACEADPVLAQHVNVDLAANVAEACANRGVRMVQISTDHLVGGSNALAVERDPVAPQNVYARTKAEAERRVLALLPGALVVRTNFYGWGPSYRWSFSEQMVRSLRQGKPLTLFSDVFYTPILAETLIEAVHALLEHGATGVLHVVGDDRVSKLDFGRRLARVFELDPTLICEGRLVDHPNLVRRPLDMSLSNSAACLILGKPLGGVDAQLGRLRQQEHLGQAKELQTL
jgi:dTDP-4-dehydrorhamnose reductase